MTGDRYRECIGIALAVREVDATATTVENSRTHQA